MKFNSDKEKGLQMDMEAVECQIFSYAYNTNLDNQLKISRHIIKGYCLTARSPSTLSIGGWGGKTAKYTNIHVYIYIYIYIYILYN